MKKLGQATLAVSPGTLIYTVPTGYITDLQDMEITNTNSSSASLTLSIVDAGDSMSASNHVFSGVSIPANTTVQWTGSQTISAGGYIKAFGSTTGINIRANGDERRLGT